MLIHPLNLLFYQCNVPTTEGYTNSYSQGLILIAEARVNKNNEHLKK